MSPDTFLISAVQDVTGRVLFEISGTAVTVVTLGTAIGMLVLAILFARLIGGLLNRIIARRTEGIAQGTLKSTVRLVQYAIMLIGVLLALDTVGVQLGALFAAGALFAVALGFAMQNVTANFISGVILLMERTIKPGDIIEIDGQIVQIREMGIRAAIGRSWNDEDLIIPSSQLVQSTVRNYTLRDPMTRIRVTVGVTYDSDMRRVRETLERVARDLPWRSRERDPLVLMKQFGSSSVDFEVSVWFEDPWHRLQRLSDVHEAIWWALKEEGITIAFPQLDVHFDPPALAALTGTAEPGPGEGEREADRVRSIEET